MGDPPVAQIAFTFTALGLLNALLLWPVVLALYLTGAENLTSESIPWNMLLVASVLLLGRHMLSPPYWAQCISIFIVVINYYCSFPRTHAVQCRRYLQHVCDIGFDNRCARFWWYVEKPLESAFWWAVVCLTITTTIAKCAPKGFRDHILF